MLGALSGLACQPSDPPALGWTHFRDVALSTSDASRLEVWGLQRTLFLTGAAVQPIRSVDTLLDHFFDFEPSDAWADRELTGPSPRFAVLRRRLTTTYPLPTECGFTEPESDAVVTTEIVVDSSILLYRDVVWLLAEQPVAVIADVSGDGLRFTGWSPLLGSYRYCARVAPGPMHVKLMSFDSWSALVSGERERHALATSRIGRDWVVRNTERRAAFASTFTAEFNESAGMAIENEINFGVSVRTGTITSCWDRHSYANHREGDPFGAFPPVSLTSTTCDELQSTSGR